MDDWLKKRLSPVKKDTQRWIELAESIQSFWETHFDPYLDRMKRSKSIYTADEAELQRKIGELGDFFQELPDEEDTAIAVAWRKLELLFKDREFIVTSTFARKFQGLPVQWVPLWAKKTDAYGTAWYRQDKLVDFSDYYLTSRGKLSVDIDEMSARRITVKEFAAHVDARMDTIKPLHIIYEGTVYDRRRFLGLYIGIIQSYVTGYTIGPPVPTFENTDTTPYFMGGFVIFTKITISQG